MAYNVSYIRQRARQYGLDPNAVIAVGGTEGLHGGVGDHGTSFGPWMLHEGGALPAGKGQAWAESPAGIDYALQRMASVARGLQGQQAIAAIVNRFERPANPGAEIQKAIGLYGGTPAAGGPAGGPLAPSSTPTASPNARSAFLQSLIAANQQSSGGRTPDYSKLVGSLVAMRSGAGAPVAPQSPGAGASVAPPSSGAAALKELFYDPLGAIKNGKRIAAIGGHSDHVHVATRTAAEMVAAITQAQRMGLSVGENPYVGVVHRVHVTDSNHYTVLGTVNGKKVGGALDVSGSPRKMAAFFKWAARNL